MNGAEIWSQINDTLGAIVWPGVVVVLVLAFRRQIGERISNIRKAKAAGLVSVELDANKAANQVFSDTVPEVLAVREPKAPTDGPEEPAGEATVTAGGGQVEVRTETTSTGHAIHPEDSADLLARRAQIEKIIRASWRAGYQVGQTSESTEPPEPNIMWTGSEPAIRGWNVVARPGSIPSREDFGVPTVTNLPSDQVLRLEAEIRRLREHGAQSSTRNPQEFLLYRELLEKLRRLDPDSPYA